MRHSFFILICLLVFAVISVILCCSSDDYRQLSNQEMQRFLGKDLPPPDANCYYANHNDETLYLKYRLAEAETIDILDAFQVKQAHSGIVKISPLKEVAWFQWNQEDQKKYYTSKMYCISKGRLKEVLALTVRDTSYLDTVSFFLSIGYYRMVLPNDVTLSELENDFGYLLKDSCDWYWE
jgi:hypothetical protein